MIHCKWVNKRGRKQKEEKGQKQLFLFTLFTLSPLHKPVATKFVHKI